MNKELNIDPSSYHESNILLDQFFY